MKNRVGLMTLDSKIYNYGGILQEFALQQVINSLGFECMIINYDKAYDTYIFSIKNDFRNISWAKIQQKIIGKKNVDDHIKVKREISLRHKAFDIFRKDFLNLSKYCNKNTINDVACNFNQFVCGSDQIWNPDYSVPSLFLDFVPEGKKKVIYAASIGKASLKYRELMQYKRYIKNLDYISVREESAQEMLKATVDKPIEVVLDPTLLLDCNVWKNFSKGNSYNDYIFCYFLGEESEKRLAATTFAKNNGLKIITLPYLLEKYNNADSDFGDVKLFDVGPQDLIGLIENAKMVLTDSFHVSVFSIIFKKEFFVFGRNIGSYNMNTRLDNLLKCFGLQERLIEPSELNSKKVLYSGLSYDDTEYKNRHSSSISYLINALK